MQVVLNLAIPFLLCVLCMFAFACAVAWLIRLSKRQRGRFPTGKCLVAALVLTLPGFISLNSTRRTAPNKSDAKLASEMYAGSRPELAESDLACLVTLSGLTREYNNIAAQIMRILGDDTVEPPKQALLLAPHVDELGKTCDSMEQCVSSLVDNGARASALEISGVFRRQQKSIAAVQAAISENNETSYDQAVQQLVQVTEERQEIGRKYMERLQELLPPKFLEQHLQERSTELQKVLNQAP